MSPKAPLLIFLPKRYLPPTINSMASFPPETRYIHIVADTVWDFWARHNTGDRLLHKVVTRHGSHYILNHTRVEPAEGECKSWTGPWTAHFSYSTVRAHSSHRSGLSVGGRNLYTRKFGIGATRTVLVTRIFTPRFLGKGSAMPEAFDRVLQGRQSCASDLLPMGLVSLGVAVVHCDQKLAECVFSSSCHESRVR